MTQSARPLLAATVFAALTASMAYGQTPTPAAKPNIVFVLMDNLGYGEVGAYGGGITRGAPTPHIDELATEGLRLTNFNVEAQCTPSRSAILTGRFSIRSGTHSVPIGEGLARISQSKGCIGPKNLRNFFYDKELADSWTGSDANRLYLQPARI
jgi:hypothetical protein